MLNEVQNFYKFFTNSWSQTRGALLDLSKIVGSGQEYDDIRYNVPFLLSMGEEVVIESDKIISQKLLAILDVKLVDDFVKGMGDKNVFLKEVHRQIMLLVAATGLVDGVNIYPPNELFEILSGKKEQYNLNRVLFTLNDASVGLNAKELLYNDIILPVLDIENVERELIGWEDALMYAMMLKMVWSSFSFLSDDDKTSIVRFTFFKAIVVGVPVEEIFKSFLFDTSSIVDFVIKHGVILEGLKQNKEEVLIDVKNIKYRLLTDIAQTHEVRKSDDKSESYLQQEYIDDLYKQVRGRDKYISWLREVLYIISAVEEGKLIEKPFFEIEQSQKKERQDVTKLLTWFFVPNRWFKFVEYLNQKDDRVPFGRFLYYCTKYFTLENDDVIQMFSDFEFFLQENNILKLNENILEFYEEDDKFHWNEGLIV